MTSRRGSWLVGLACVLATPWLAAAEPVDCDVLLRGGTLHDGAGGPPVVGDVAIRGDRIVAIGTFPTGQVGRTLDCRGLIVAPGFIDLHSHSDEPIQTAASRGNVNFLTQGCTTVVTGNCGFGPVDAGAYYARIEEHGAGTNVAHLLPQGSLRSEVLGKANRTATPEELRRIEELADRAMVDGCWGMSTGLIYVPGTYTKTDELIAVARVVARHGGIYASHIRNEGSELFDAIEEALRIGREAELPVHISHFKASGRSNWGQLRIAAGLIERARQAGQRVTADQYPYVASSTSLEATVLPAWSREGGRSALEKRLADPEDRARIRAAIEPKLVDAERIQLARCGYRPAWVGKRLDEVARLAGQPVADVVLDIESHGGASVVHFSMSEEDVRYAMTLDWVATASDGSARVPDGDQPHPRNFGTFSRKVGRYAIEEGVLPVEQAIRSASGLPADILGLADRGYLRPEQFADVVVFDPRSFRDRSEFDDPYHYSTGVRYVFVNGVAAVYDGTPTGALAGRPLRRGAKAE